MKLFIKISIVCVLLLISSIYIFIPNTIKISRPILVKSSNETALRFFQNSHLRKRWWPVNDHILAQDSLDYIYKNTVFNFEKGYLDYLPVKTSIDDLQFATNLTLLPASPNTIEMQWKTSIKASFNPIKRLMQYRSAKALHSHFGDLLYIFKSFIEDDRKVYGLNIQVSKVKNPVLITMKSRSPNYPTPSLIYNSINQLKTTIKNMGALQIDSPMLNVVKTDKNEYDIQTAIPVNQSIEAPKNQMIKRMVLGRILVTEVKGGSKKVESALVELENYLKDKNLVSPAIPYQSLITNRIEVPDSSKWVTKIYYPIY